MVPGEFRAVPRGGRRITFRMLHVRDLRDWLMSRENVWPEWASIVAQLTTPDLATTST